MQNSNCVLIIPTLNPNDGFVEFIKTALEYFSRIIVVNDGSNAEFAPIFDAIKSLGGVTYISHKTNMGKGRAIKSAIEYYQKSALYLRYQGIITADSDGQHLLKDICSIDKAVGENPDKSFFIGYRNLNSPIMPKRSKIGNKVTAFLYRALYGVSLKDTQSGLRAFRNGIISDMSLISGERFEWEMNVLIKLKDADFKTQEIPIETKYERVHKSTFRTIKDSSRVMFVLLAGIIKYLLSALCASIVDVGAFALLYYGILPPLNISIPVALLIASVISRLSSSVINYLVNRFITFGGKRISRKSIIKYYLLWFFQLITSYGLLTFFSVLFGGGEIVVKIIVDLSLALLSYQIQLRYVFKKKEQA